VPLPLLSAMDRRRAPKTRPASSEETQCWSHARSSLVALSSNYASQQTIDSIERANRLINSWPKNDTLPAEGINGVRVTAKKLAATLETVKAEAEKDCKAIDEALERLGLVIALRSAPETLPPEKRNKRPRAQSPSAASSNGTPALSRSVSITIPPRNSVGPHPSTSYPRDMKTRKEHLFRQLPLQLNRKVAFHVPAKPGTADESNWILAFVTKCLEKNKYEVQDPEPQETGEPGLTYIANLKSLLPLPDPMAPPNSASHPNAYPEYPVGARVLALYPDTSCFYRAEVISSNKDTLPAGRANIVAKQQPTYKLQFDDDDVNELSVLAQWVVECPLEDKR
jgi:SAGA-associated factor 29